MLEPGISSEESRAGRAKDETGVTLCELMVTVGLSTIVALGLASISLGFSTQVHSTRLVASRDLLNSQLQSLAGSPRAIFNSYDRSPPGSLLRACLDSTPGDCTVPASDEAPSSYDFTLFGPVGDRELAGGGDSGTLAVRYTRNGGPCPPLSLPSLECPYRTRAFFVPSCEAAQTSCDRAVSIRVFARLESDLPNKRELAFISTPRNEGSIVESSRVLGFQFTASGGMSCPAQGDDASDCESCWGNKSSFQGGCPAGGFASGLSQLKIGSHVTAQLRCIGP